MDDFTIEDILKDAIDVVENSSPEELNKLLNKDSTKELYDRIIKFESLRTKAENSENINKKEILILINLIQFIRISIFDLVVSSDQYLKTIDGNKLVTQFSLRVCSLIIYEIIKDFPNMLGKETRDCISHLSKQDVEIMEDLNNITTQINHFISEDIGHRIKNIRNYSIAHKEQDSKKLLHIIDSINDEDVMVLTTSIFLWNKLFEKFLEKLMSKIKDININDIDKL
jgi:hypothetical protein